MTKLDLYPILSIFAEYVFLSRKILLSSELGNGESPRGVEFGQLSVSNFPVLVMVVT